MLFSPVLVCDHLGKQSRDLVLMTTEAVHPPPPHPIAQTVGARYAVMTTEVPEPLSQKEVPNYEQN